MSYDAEKSESIWNSLAVYAGLQDELETAGMCPYTKTDSVWIGRVRDDEKGLRDEGKDNGVTGQGMQLLIEAVKKSDAFRASQQDQQASRTTLTRRMSRLQESSDRISDRLSNVEHHSRSPRKDTGRGNHTLEHAYLKFFPSYISSSRDVKEYDVIWKPTWKAEKFMYDPTVEQLNQRWNNEKHQWERTDGLTMRRDLLGGGDLNFFEQIVGVDMSEANLRLPDVMLLDRPEKEEEEKQKGKKKKKKEGGKKEGEKKEDKSKETRDRSWAIGVELKRPIYRITQLKLAKEGKRRGKRQREQEEEAEGAPAKKKRRISQTETNSNNDGSDEESDEESDEDMESSTEDDGILFGLFRTVAHAAKEHMVYDLAKLTSVGLVRSADNNVHSVESWRKTIHQLATLACTCRELRPFVILSDMDPLFCSYLFWLSRATKNQNQAPIICMSRVRYSELAGVLQRLRTTQSGKMFPSEFQPMSLKDFEPTDFVPPAVLSD